MDPVTPTQGETGTPKAPENVTPTSTPVQGNVDDTAVEKLRKEKEQAEMRANQLANKLKAKEDAEAAAEAKKLEEQNEYKTLYEQERAKRERLESDREAEEKRKELDAKRKEAAKDFADEVRTEAEELGITLDSTDDADVEAYRAKLEKIQKRQGTTAKVGPNNPPAPSKQAQLNQDELRMAMKDPAKFQEIIAKRPGLAAMLRPQS